MRPVFILGIILLLVGCKQRDERVLMVDEQGSFAVGGTVLVDSLGHTFMATMRTYFIKSRSEQGNTHWYSPMV